MISRIGIVLLSWPTHWLASRASHDTPRHRANWLLLSKPVFVAEGRASGCALPHPLSTKRRQIASWRTKLLCPEPERLQAETRNDEARLNPLRTRGHLDRSTNSINAHRRSIQVNHPGELRTFRHPKVHLVFEYRAGVAMQAELDQKLRTKWRERLSLLFAQGAAVAPYDLMDEAA